METLAGSSAGGSAARGLGQGRARVAATARTAAARPSSRRRPGRPRATSVRRRRRGLLDGHGGDAVVDLHLLAGDLSLAATREENCERGGATSTRRARPRGGVKISSSSATRVARTPEAAVGARAGRGRAPRAVRRVLVSSAAASSRGEGLFAGGKNVRAFRSLRDDTCTTARRFGMRGRRRPPRARRRRLPSRHLHDRAELASSSVFLSATRTSTSPARKPSSVVAPAKCNSARTGCRIGTTPSPREALAPLAIRAGRSHRPSWRRASAALLEVRGRCRAVRRSDTRAAPWWRGVDVRARRGECEAAANYERATTLSRLG